MPISKQKKKSSSATVSKDNDADLLQSEIANFASSLGLSSSVPSAGFDDSDFRKRAPIKKNPKIDIKKNDEKFKDNNNKKNTDKFKNSNKKEKEEPPNPPPKPKAQIHFSVDNSKMFDKFKNLPKLPLIKASSLGVWYDDAAELEEKLIGSGVNRKKVEFKNVEEWKGLVEKKKELAERLLAQYVHDYELSRGQSGDIKMVLATQRSGTVTDKVSAFSVLVGDNPIANIKSIDALVSMVTSKVGKRYAFTGFEALKEMFISSLLPDRKLRTLFQQPLNHLPDSKDGNSLLLFWHWEECLKQRYERYIFALEEASRDVLATLKDKALKTIYALLKSKSEQERRLLSALVNKLGDPENKAASNADYLLSKLLSDHPNMKAVVVDEVDNFLFRPHLVLRAKYHGVNFLSQIRLSHIGDGPKVAKRLVDVYFALFKVLISEAGGKNKEKKSKEDYKKPKDKDAKKDEDPHVEMDSRLLSALLTGVNRAFPFVASNEADDIVESQTPMLFQLVHSKNFNVGVQALMLLDKISSKNQIVSDRFYRALYSKLLLPSAMNSSKEEMFIGLLLRAMKNDLNLKRVSAFAKRLLQVSLQQPPQYACACIFLLSEVLKSKPPLWNMVLQNELADEELEHFEDIVEEQDKPGGSGEAVLSNNGVHDDDDDDDDNDMPEDEVRSPAASSDDDLDKDDDLLGFGGLTELRESQRKSGDDKSQPRVQTLPGGYDPRHREPTYSNAERVGWWELMVLASHVHPSVSTMAKTLLSGANIVYNGNPLNDLSLVAFLDKFMEKKPKERNWHGGSQIEPAKQLDMSKPLIGADILQLDEMDVAPEDVVFHRFYMNKLNSTKKPKKKKKKGAEDEAAEDLIGEDGEEDDEAEDESDNEEIEAILDSTNSALNADGEYDYDDLDEIVDGDDEDLVGDVSDDEGMEFPTDIADDDDDDDDDDDGVSIGDAEDGSDDEEDVFEVKPKKRKAGASPFASLEDYEHLLEDDDDEDDNGKDTKKQKKSKKAKMSKPKKKKASIE